MPGRQDIKAGRAYVELLLRDSRFLRGLRGAATKLVSFAKAAAITGAALGGAAVAGVIPLIKAASDLQETMGKFNVVFGSNATAVKKWGDEYAKAVGRSEKQIAEFLAGSQDLFVPLGFAADEAERLSKQVTTLAVDLASFNNKTDAEAMRDLQAALTGSGEVMKKYGVIVSEAAVKQEALNMGLDPKRLTEQQKVQARLNIIMRGTTAAQGDAIRTAGSFANQMKGLQGAFMDTAAELGNALLPGLTVGVGKIKDFLNAAREFAQQNPLLQALKAGEFKLAGEIAMASLELAIAQGTNKILDVWDGFKDTLSSVWDDVLGDMTSSWTDFRYGISQLAIEMVAAVKKAVNLLEPKRIEAKYGLAKFFTRVTEAASRTGSAGTGAPGPVTTQEERDAATAEANQRIAILEKLQRDEEESFDLDGQLKRIEEERKAALEILERERKKENSGASRREDVTNREASIAALQAQLDALGQRAAAAAAAAGNAAAGGAASVAGGASAGRRAGASAGTTGSFSAAALAASGQSPVEKAVKAGNSLLEKIRGLTDEQLKFIKSTGATFTN